MTKEHEVECLIHPDGSETWWKGGNRHRKGLPAVILRNGTELSFSHGQEIVRIDPRGNVAIPCAATGHWVPIPDIKIKSWS